MKEVWKPFPLECLKNTHEISNFGLVRYKNNKEIIARNIRSGYLNLIYSILIDGVEKMKTVKIHRMVAKAFVKNDDLKTKTFVNHINTDKYDCRASNLEWTTASGNVQHAIDNGLITITKRAVIKCNLKTGKDIKQYESILQASKENDIDDSAISKVCTGERNSAGGFGWKYVEENPNQTTDVDLSKYKQIVEFPNYLLNEDGKIYSLSYKKFLKFQINSEGCQCIQLTNEGKTKDFLVHRLVASHFLKRTDKKHNSIKHIDGNKTNNQLDNLKWCYIPGVDSPKVNYRTPYYNPESAIKPAKRKSVQSGPKDLLTANPKNLSKKQREERKKLLEKKATRTNSGSKTAKPKLKVNKKERVYEI